VEAEHGSSAIVCVWAGGLEGLREPMICIPGTGLVEPHTSLTTGRSEGRGVGYSSGSTAPIPYLTIHPPSAKFSQRLRYMRRCPDSSDAPHLGIVGIDFYSLTYRTANLGGQRVWYTAAKTPPLPGAL